MAAIDESTINLYLVAGNKFGRAELMVTGEVLEPEQPGHRWGVSNKSDVHSLPEVEVVDPNIDEKHAAERRADNERLRRAQDRCSALVRKCRLAKVCVCGHTAWLRV